MWEGRLLSPLKDYLNNGILRELKTTFTLHLLVVAILLFLLEQAVYFSATLHSTLLPFSVLGGFFYANSLLANAASLVEK